MTTHGKTDDTLIECNTNWTLKNVRSYAQEVLISLYTKTLKKIQAVPEDEGYRKAVESFTEHILNVCQEEHVEEAEDELTLIAKMIEY
ncbi:hypothetical protein K1719_000774 [Acacia pycnantha]|nr:hypothetical protein K1719_000774 [Acacia pycnantha]